jgi:hypothetical protein
VVPQSRAGTSTPLFSIDWHVVSPGGTQLRSGGSARFMARTWNENR